MKSNPGEIYKEFNIKLGHDRDQSVKYTQEYINYVQEIEKTFNTLI